MHLTIEKTLYYINMSCDIIIMSSKYTIYHITKHQSHNIEDAHDMKLHKNVFYYSKNG